MRPALVWGAAAWTLAYGAVYVAVARAQGGGPALWYLASVLAGAVLLAGAAVRSSRTLHVAALVVLAGCAVLGLLSVGPLLLPAVAASAVALAVTGPRGAPNPAAVSGALAQALRAIGRRLFRGEESQSRVRLRGYRCCGRAHGYRCHRRANGTGVCLDVRIR